MIILAYLIVLIPLVAYIAAFSYETVLSFLRLSKTYQRRHKYQGYAHATWEITHTLLVFSFTSFFVLFSPLALEFADRAYIPLFTVGIFFTIRGILYLYLFYIAGEQKPRPFWDTIFALSHLLLLTAAAWAVLTTIQLLRDVPVTPLLDLVPVVAPPVVLVLAISAVPVIRLYSVHKKS